MPFCPVCSAELRDSNPSECWNCGADFSSPKAWKPLAKPTGTFHASEADADAQEQGSRVGAFLVRLILGFLLWCALGVLALGSAVPYGGGSSVLLGLWFLSTLVLPLWALAAFIT